MNGGVDWPVAVNRFRHPALAMLLACLGVLLAGLACTTAEAPPRPFQPPPPGSPLLQVPTPTPVTAVPTPVLSGIAPTPGSGLDPFYAEPARFGLDAPRNTSGVLRLAIPAPPASHDPFRGALDPAWHQVHWAAWDPLVAWRMTPDSSVFTADLVCRVCGGWSLSDDGRQWKFRMRPGQRWHDGTAVTAADVAASLRAHLALQAPAAPPQSLPRTVDRITAEGDVVTITTRTTDPDLLAALERLPLAPLAVAEGRGDPLVASGAFRLARAESWGLRFDRARTYALGGRPWLERIEVQVIPDPAIRQALFLNGLLDAWVAPARSLAEEAVRGRQDLAVQPFRTGLAMALVPSQRDAPWNDRAVRRALDLTIDRAGLLDGLPGSSLAGPATAPQRPWSLSPDELARQPGTAIRPPDPEGARELLRSAGYPDGVFARLLVDTTLPEAQRLAAVVVTGAARAGFRLEPAFQPGPLPAEAGLRLVATDAGLPLPQAWAVIQPGWDGGARVSDPVLATLLATQASTFDRDLRYQALRQVQRRVLDQHHVLPLVEVTAAFAWNRRVHNLRSHGAGTTLWIPAGTAETLWMDRNP